MLIARRFAFFDFNLKAEALINSPKSTLDIFLRSILRSGKILLHNGAILRNAVPTPNE